ncbi:hypothetical protein CIPAW_12G010900 [Carya illinoinensis]|uniref:Uncharacterized protein n=1 Tax=Carya illinoinensis TaxID=32201 RepID=A0A8T1NLM4_CARIL|nr:hypothetical protein CIPAW_12G010900 [Carya illinoinensis]
MPTSNSAGGITIVADVSYYCLLTLPQMGLGILMGIDDGISSSKKQGCALSRFKMQGLIADIPESFVSPLRLSSRLW